MWLPFKLLFTLLYQIFLLLWGFITAWIRYFKAERQLKDFPDYEERIKARKAYIKKGKG
jgi:hypothetical protein